MTTPGRSGAGEIGLADLEFFWDVAARKVPIMVVGGGRWGRVWLQVLTSARGSAENMTWVARTDHAGAESWARSELSVAGIAVVGSIASGLSVLTPEVAIIASRPRDHGADARAALDSGAHVLVEKPISPTSGAARALLDEAMKLQLRLGIGCEFAFMPALQTLREALGAPTFGETFTIEWSDPAAEIRHGAVKRQHDEITMLVDLLPHAWSIFRALRPDARFTLAEAALQEDGNAGTLELVDQNGARYGLICDRSAASRRRHLRAVCGNRLGTLDFARHPSTVTVGGVACSQSPKAVALASVLRIEIGAFLADAGGLTAIRPLTDGLDDLVILQAELESVCG